MALAAIADRLLRSMLVPVDAPARYDLLELPGRHQLGGAEARPRTRDGGKLRYGFGTSLKTRTGGIFAALVRPRRSRRHRPDHLIAKSYTSADYRPVKSIAAASVTGHGKHLCRSGSRHLHGGDGVVRERHHRPNPRHLLTYGMAGLYGIAVAVTIMRTLAGMVVALDAFALATDNAGGRTCPACQWVTAH